jgi:hypothetical protein
VISLAGCRNLLGGASIRPEVVGIRGVVGNAVGAIEASGAGELQPAATA